MKRTRLYVMAMVALLLGLSACDNEQHAPELLTNEVYLTATSQTIRVAGANDNEWEGNESIGLYSAELSAVNKQFTNKEAGASSMFEAATESERIPLPAGNATYSVSAYYPYSVDATAEAVTFDLNEMGEQPILYAVAHNVSRTQPNANFSFKHLLGKLVINIKTEEGIEIADDLSVTLNSAETKLTLNPVNGDLNADAEMKNLTLNRIGGTNTFYSFVMPRVGAMQRTLTIINGSKSYSAVINHEIKAKVRYTFNVTLKADRVDVGDGGSEIEGGEDGGSSDVPGEPMPENIVITPAESAISVPSAGRSGKINVTINPEGTEWSASSNMDWLTVIKEGSTIAYTAAENNGAERKAIITITAGAESAAISVTQEAKSVAPVNNALYPNGFDGFVILDKSRESQIKPVIEKGAGRTADMDAIRLAGSSKGNSYIMAFNVPENMPKNPTKITFWIKGTSTGKSINIVNKTNTGYGFNLGNVGSEEVELSFSKLKYGGEINATDWVRVTLDLTSAGDMYQNMQPNAELFWIKTGKTGTYDLLISDFEVF